MEMIYFEYEAVVYTGKEFFELSLPEIIEELKLFAPTLASLLVLGEELVLFHEEFEEEFLYQATSEVLEMLGAGGAFGITSSELLISFKKYYTAFVERMISLYSELTTIPIASILEETHGVLLCMVGFYSSRIMASHIIESRKEEI